jgi:putative PIN family toxin of toxin-antitoxin system
MNPLEFVVFDCNVYFQAFISETGPAGQLLEAVNQKQISLFLSEFVLDELRDVLSRPSIVSKFKFTDQRVTDYLATLVELATMVADVPHVFDFPRDPTDSHYVDLALAVHAKLIVSRDKDLLSLRDSSTVEGREFLARFPNLLILTPPEALKLIQPTPPSE